MSKKQGGPVRLGKALRLLAGAAMAVLLPAVAPAQQKTLYVGMNGGGMAEAYAKHVFPDFERAQGVRIEVVPGTSAEVLARAQAQKGKPGMHLMFLDDGVMVRAVAAGLCQPLRDDPVLRELYPTAVRRDRKAVGLNVGMTGLGYNTRLFARQGWAPPRPGWTWPTPVQGQGGDAVRRRQHLRPARFPHVQPHPGRHRCRHQSRLSRLARLGRRQCAGIPA